MWLTKFTHSCVLVEEGGTRLLIDPGTFSRGFEDVEDLAGILVTHQHPDHLDVERLAPLLERNPQAGLWTDPGSADQLRAQGLHATAVDGGDRFDVGEVPVVAVGSDHAVIHPDIPGIPNVGYLVAGRFLHPGDALTVPQAEVDILALPTAAPWMKLAEAVDYLRAVAPRVAVPIHEAVAAMPQMYYGRFESLGPDRTTLVVIDDGSTRDL